MIEFANVASPLRVAPRVAAPTAASVPVAFDVGCLCASMRIPSHHAWVVLKQSYDDNWKLRTDRGSVLRHVVFAGYGNAWEVLVPPGSEASLVYAPAATWQALVVASLIAWILVAVGSGVALWTR